MRRHWGYWFALVVLGTVVWLGINLYQEFRWTQCLEPVEFKEQHTTFDCSCSKGSEEARYPDRIDVLISECLDPYLGFGDISPSGRYLLVVHDYNRPLQGAQAYLHDVVTGRSVPLPDQRYFLSDELLLQVDKPNSLAAEQFTYTLYDVTGTRLLRLNWVPMKEDFSFDSSFLKYFQNAEQVYVSPPAGIAVALAPGFLHHPEANYVLGRMGINPTQARDVIRLLKTHPVKYQVPVPWAYDYQTDDVVIASGLTEIRSRNRQFEFLNRGSHGIYLITTQQQVTPPYREDLFVEEGWVYEDQGVILAPSPSYFPTRPLGPILLLKVPKEYLSPVVQQVEEQKLAARAQLRAEAQTERMQLQRTRTFIVGGLIVISLGVIGWKVLQRVRSRNHPQ
jgi:hypothetical protein